MTSSRTAVRKRITERNVQGAVVDRLRWHGWVVRELSQPVPVHGELIGVPDVIAWKMGVTLLIECKRPGGRARPSQVQFADEIEPHLRLSLNYVLVDDVDNFGEWLHDVECMAGIVTVREER